MQPLAGGFSGETFLSEVAGEQTVVRIYGGRSATRGPRAVEIDAAVLDLVRGLLPVPTVLEVRRPDVTAGLPGILVTSLLPGTRLDLLLPTLDAAQTRTVAGRLGVLLGRLGHMALPQHGLFTGPDLAIGPFPEGGGDIDDWVDRHAAALYLAAEDLPAVRALALEAQALLDEEQRTCLVHSDFNLKNLLVDPDTLEVTGVLDWEYTHAGSPYADLGNLLRFADDAFAEAVLAAYADFMPAVPDDLAARAQAADLFALVELASRHGENEVTDRAHALLVARARAHA
jgi:Ser/Thr protein kinase RdoA (MazF antagonist)